MKKLFCRTIISAILVALVGSGALAQQARKDDKEKVRIVVVDKKERDSSGNGTQSQKHPENRKRP